MKEPVDWSVYLVTDRALAGGRPIEEVAAAALRGGVRVVQLREKEASTREFIDLARRFKELLAPEGVPLIINDRVDVALAAGADGVHIGQSDMEYADSRRLMGPDAIIGLSVETMEQAERAMELDVDYLGVGPIFSTATKPDAAVAWGTGALGALRATTNHVLIAIGGINAINAAAVMDAGADGIAVVSAICAARDPERVARELRWIVEASARG